MPGSTLLLLLQNTGTPLTPLVIGDFYSVQVAEDTDFADVDPDLATLLN